MFRVITSTEPIPETSSSAFEQIRQLYPTLTPRLYELWLLLVQGLSNRAIAHTLGLQPKWIDNAVGLLYGALDIATQDPQFNARVQAVLIYARVVGSRSTGLDEPGGAGSVWPDGQVETPGEASTSIAC